MPPSLRTRTQQHDFPPPHDEEVSDSDASLGLDRTRARGRAEREGEGIDDELVGMEGEEELEDEEEAPNRPNTPLPNLDPPPPYLREISTLASWTVSSSKPGCSIPQLRHPSSSLFWQSDGPQPHYLNIHFFKLVRIVGLRLYLDFEQDESYTPTKIIFLAGSGMNDLQEWGEMRLESPRGWVWADFSGVGDPDSDSEDEEEDQRMIDGPETAAPLHANEMEAQTNDASSDSENNNPQHRQRHLPPPPIEEDDAMHIDPQIQHQTPQPQLHFTPTNPRTAHPHNQTPIFTPPTHTHTQSLTRSIPRLPFAALSPNTTQPHPSRQRRPAMPVLRAHLVQIKILENHQNGKDTHLRGLQVFARNDEKEVDQTPIRRVVKEGVRGMGDGRGKEVERRTKGRRKVERLELGGFGEEMLR
jgi:anaphase-promoting complex subunit 10